MHVWLNGQVVDPVDATVPVNDHGLVVGDGAFETMKVLRGEAFALTRHLARLRRTLDALAIEMPDEAFIRRGAAEVIAAAGRDTGRLRITVTGGSGPLSSGAPSGPPAVVAAITELGPPSDPSIKTVPWTRNERGALTGLKTTSYAENVRALRAAHDAGAGEAIFANTVGELCEGTGTNIFVVEGGEVLTPPLASGCLAGVSRALVLELTDVTERSLPFDILQTANEVFLASTMRDVQGIVRIDGRELEVGARTKEVAQAFAGLVATNLDP